jgi:hypothetical protein
MSRYKEDWVLLNIRKMLNGLAQGRYLRHAVGKSEKEGHISMYL